MITLDISVTEMRVLKHLLLRWGDPLSVTEICRELDAKFSTMRQMMMRLRGYGWVEALRLPRDDRLPRIGRRGRPDLIFYVLTTEGREAFLTRLASLTIPDNYWREIPENPKCSTSSSSTPERSTASTAPSGTT